ncbi:unannotated protein [freshwater metagenome]|uniref:Unannotated protein n=1 Tax=freshwater metagenome TaxID=449393 RepID=A0A6J7MX46_9ZZZZ
MPTTLWSVVYFQYFHLPWPLPAMYSASSWVRSWPSIQRIGPANAPMPIMKPMTQAT